MAPRKPKAPKNKYKQIPVAWVPPVKDEALPPRPDFDVGDTVTTVFKSMFHTFTEPIKVLEIVHDKMYMSGWRVRVDTNMGDLWLDSSHLTKKN